MALDFTHARYYMDDPAYRYSRVLYPVLAQAAALGNADRVPASMLAINWLALGIGTLAVAAWLRRRLCSPWLALCFGLYPGLLLGLQRDLTEPLAYALAAAGVYLFDYGGTRRLLWSGTVFGLAGLARQTTIVFPLCYAVATAFAAGSDDAADGRPHPKPVRAAGFLALAIVPIVAYTGALYAWLGALGKGAFLERAPFEGLIASTGWELTRQPVVLVTVVAPALLLAGTAVSVIRRGVWRVEVACLLANVLLFVVFVGRAVYSAGYTTAGRVAAGVVLAGLFCVPWLRDQGRRTAIAVALSGALWLSMLPVIAVYGFGG
jgi:hypothetical protein